MPARLNRLHPRVVVQLYDGTHALMEHNVVAASDPRVVLWAGNPSGTIAEGKATNYGHEPDHHAMERAVRDPHHLKPIGAKFWHGSKRNSKFYHTHRALQQPRR